MTKPPTVINLVLKETDTIFLLDIPSSTAFRDTKNGEAVTKDNEIYEYLTSGNGRNRKMADVSVQTLPVLPKTRRTETAKIEFKSDSTFVSNWEMFDTYNDQQTIKETKAEEIESDDEISLDDEHKLIDTESSVETTSEIFKEDVEVQELWNNSGFLVAVEVIERLLANNCYNTQQKRYKGLLGPEEPPDARKEYKYSLDLLWSFANNDTKGKCVVGVTFNTFNDDILAVGYGKYYFTDQNSGIVMVWNVKNPVQPERQYNFPVCVTCLEFSRSNPNLLAIGLYDGSFQIVDVNLRTNNVLLQRSPSFEPIWQVVWHKNGIKSEDLLVSCGDGKIYLYLLDNGFETKPMQIMRTYRTERTTKGIIVEITKYADNRNQIVKNSSAQVLAFHPVDPMTYYIGTNEGIMYKCSVNYMHRYLDLMKVHIGSFHRIAHSPFVNKVFMTMGDDFVTRIWIDGVYEPLITLKLTFSSVNDGDWSPTHSTIIITILEEWIVIWDLQRKFYEPQAKIRSPAGVCNVICRFTPNGRCLVVGDIDGNLHVFSVEDLPHPAFFQENLFQQAFNQVLVTKPELLSRMRKMGPLNYEKEYISRLS